jgi:hypothetical protein
VGYLGEERRRTEPPEPESPNQTLMQIQQTLGQLVGQVNEISRTVQRQGEILNSRELSDAGVAPWWTYRALYEP